MPLEVISFITKCVTTIPKQLTLAQWDIIEICLASWNLSVKKSIDHHTDLKVCLIVSNLERIFPLTFLKTC